MPMYGEGFSIVVCCYNSAKRLPQTIASLSSLSIPENTCCEIIIVDNNSTDGTAEVARQQFAKNASSIPFKVVFEGEPGLSFARKRGATEAQYSYLVFCDDDNHFFNDYIAHAWEVIKIENVAGIGGLGIPLYESTPPDWFKRYEANFATGKQHSLEGIIDYGITMYGAGLVIRHDVYDKIKEASLIFGITDRKANATSSGEDSLTILLGHYLGYKFYFCEKMKFYHLIEDRRINWVYLNDLFYSFGSASALLSPLTHEMRNVSELKAILVFLKSLRFLTHSRKTANSHSSLMVNHNLGFRNSYMKNILKYFRIRRAVKALSKPAFQKQPEHF